MVPETADERLRYRTIPGDSEEKSAEGGDNKNRDVSEENATQSTDTEYMNRHSDRKQSSGGDHLGQVNQGIGYGKVGHGCWGKGGDFGGYCG